MKDTKPHALGNQEPSRGFGGAAIAAKRQVIVVSDEALGNVGSYHRILSIEILNWDPTQ